MSDAVQEALLVLADGEVFEGEAIGARAPVTAGEVDRGQRIVVTVTGHGLKDVATALSGFEGLVDQVVDSDVTAAAAAAGLA